MFVLGDVPVDDTLYLPFDTYDSNGASVTITGLAVTDIEIYKDGVVTTRASDNGYTLLDTDGIDFAGTVGLHGFSVDLSDNSDVGFYVAGSTYWVNVDAITVDSQTVRFTYVFTIGKVLRPTTAGRTLGVSAAGLADADVLAISGDTTAADNLELGYDGTGLLGDTFPLRQDQGASISGGLAVRSNMTSVTVIQGSEQDLANTNASDDTRWTGDDDGAGAEFIFRCTPADTTASPGDLHFEGYYDEPVGATNGATISVYNFQTAAWEAHVALTNASSDEMHDVLLAHENGAPGGGTLETVAYTIGDVLIKFEQDTQETGNACLLIDRMYVGFISAPVTAAETADAVWDEPVAGHVAVGSFGKTDADILADTDNLQTSQGNWLTATGFSTHDAAAVYTAFGTGSNLTALATATGFSTHTAAGVWAVDATGEQTQGTFGQAVGDPGATAKSLWQATVSDAAGVSVSADVIAVKTDTGNLVTRITATLFSGITALAEWLGILGGKQAGNATALTEMKATGAGSGTIDPTTDSLEAGRDRGDAAYITATGFAVPGDQMTASAAERNAVADALLKRDMSNVEATAPEHSLCYVVLAMTEADTTTSVGFLTVFETDGVTEFVQKAITTDGAADPITGVQ